MESLKKKVIYMILIAIICWIMDVKKSIEKEQEYFEKNKESKERWK